MFGLIMLAASGATNVDAPADASAPAAVEAPTPATSDTPPPADTPPTAPVVNEAPAATKTGVPAAPAPDTAALDTPIVAPANTVACDVILNVDDPDPKGLNVRATPDAKKGKVIAVLKPVGEWTQVHVTGQSGNWMRIDHAEAVDDNAENGQRSVFQGDGWVYTSKLGISELYVGDGTIIRDQPKREGAVLLQLDTDEKEPKATKVLGCEASYIKINFDGKIGWTRDWCTNERTTCS
jgi:type V secretory pathway adhesin AidA